MITSARYCVRSFHGDRRTHSDVADHEAGLQFRVTALVQTTELPQPKLTQRTAQIHSPLTIQFQAVHRSASDGRNADDYGMIFVSPGEVFVPVVPAWMKEPHTFTRNRVVGGYGNQFEIIAAITGKL